MNTCFGCQRSFPDPLIHDHHSIPRAAGGEGTKTTALCPLCHGACHAAAKLFLKGEHGKARDIIYVTVRGDGEAERRLWGLVQVEARAWEAGGEAKEQLLHFKLPRHRYELLKSVAHGLKKPDGRSLGIQNLLAMIVEQWISRYTESFQQTETAPEPIKRPKLMVQGLSETDPSTGSGSRSGSS